MASFLPLGNLQGEYVELVRLVAAEGEPASPRGLPTRELRDVTLHFSDTSNLMPVGVGRGVSTKLNAYGAAALVAGEHLPKMATAIAPAVALFDTDGVDRERYGPRIIDQVAGIVAHLVDDPDTREAIATLQPARNEEIDGGRDFPCTTSVQFLLRDGLLHMTVSMRSNDVWHGLSGDAWTFGQLQHTLASVLGVGAGEYTHHAASLHLYERDLFKLRGLHAPDHPGLVPVKGFRPRGGEWGDDAPSKRLLLARAMARYALGRATVAVTAADNDQGIDWYLRQLKPFWAFS